VFSVSGLQLADKTTETPVDGRAPDRPFGPEPLVQKVVAHPKFAVERTQRHTRIPVGCEGSQRGCQNVDVGRGCLSLRRAPAPAGVLLSHHSKTQTCREPVTPKDASIHLRRLDSRLTWVAITHLDLVTVDRDHLCRAAPGGDQHVTTYVLGRIGLQ